jgi:inhibitor of cysteine peptidase
MGASRVLTMQDHGSTVTLRPGETLELHLEENPTTGYRWELGGGAEVGAAVDGTYSSSGTGAGAGGVKRFTITPSRAGDTQLHATLRRSWEPPSAAPLQEFTATLRVVP